MSADLITEARAVIEAGRCVLESRDTRWCVVHNAWWPKRDAGCKNASDDLLDTATKLLAALEAVNRLFAGGPDTPCHTVWRDDVECVAVPVDDLRAALTPKEGDR